MASRAFLSSSDSETSEDLCLICLASLGKEAKTSLGLDPWIKLVECAKKWQELDIPESDPSYNFTTLYRRFANLPNPRNSNYSVHKACKLNMTGIKLSRCAKKYKAKNEAIAIDNQNTLENLEITPQRSSTRRSNLIKKCFVCDIVTDNDNQSFNKGGLARCSQHSALLKLEIAQAQNVKDHNDTLYPAALRYKMAISGSSHDIFAADIHYHKSCYNKFIKIKEKDTDELENLKLEKIDSAVQNFVRCIKQKILREKKAYLLVDLLKDLEDFREEEGLEEPIASTTLSLRRIIEKNIPEKISFHLIGKKLMAYSTDINPCIYLAATLEGNGIRDEELTRGFAKMIRKKVAKKEQKWPITPEELLLSLDSKGPFRELYNVIAWSMHPERTLNENGFVPTPSRVEANKIWALSSDWETLLTKERSPKATALSLTIHRMTGSKETLRYLHNCGHGISYNDIQLLNSEWAKIGLRSSKVQLPQSIEKRRQFTFL